MLAPLPRRLLRYALLAAADRVATPAPGRDPGDRPVPTAGPPAQPSAGPAGGRRARIWEGAVGNALGTVVAAPVVYLGAVAAGLVRADPRPLLVALAPLAVATGVLLGRRWVRRPRVPRWQGDLAFLLPGLVVLGASLWVRALGEDGLALLASAQDAVARGGPAAVSRDTLAALLSQARLLVVVSVAAGLLFCCQLSFLAAVSVLGRGRVPPLEWRRAGRARLLGVLAETVALVALAAWVGYVVVTTGLAFPTVSLS